MVGSEKKLPTLRNYRSRPTRAQGQYGFQRYLSLMSFPAYNLAGNLPAHSLR